MTQQEWAEQARNGDERAFRRLYDANVDRIYRLMYRMAGEEHLAKDFTQEAFLRAYQKLDQFRGASSFSTWLHAIAVSVALNGIRKADRHRKREHGLDGLADILPDPTDGRAEPGVRERIEEAVDGLPDIYRTVFLMHDLEGYGHGEIAEALGVAEGTSKARLSRARAKLRETLGDAMREYA